MNAELHDYSMHAHLPELQQVLARVAEEEPHRLIDPQFIRYKATLEYLNAHPKVGQQLHEIMHQSSESVVDQTELAMILMDVFSTYIYSLFSLLIHFIMILGRSLIILHLKNTHLYNSIFLFCSYYAFFKKNWFPI